MTELLYQDFLLLQIPLFTSFFGTVTIAWGHITGRDFLITVGLIAYFLTGIAGIPLYFSGEEILHFMRIRNFTEEQITSYKADYYTTLIVAFFLSLTALMGLIMQRALNRIPRLFLYPVVIYAVLFILYLGWRSFHPAI